MTELAKAKRRIAQLERCLQDVDDMVREELENYACVGWSDRDEAKDLRKIERRVGRTLYPPQKKTSP